MKKLIKKFKKLRENNKFSKPISIIIGLAFAVMFILTIYFWYNQSEKQTNNIICGQVHKLSSIFYKIHDRCEINKFAPGKTPINYLNVRSFDGSEVGGINLTFPKKWEGPYVEDNPTMQGKPYYILNIEDDEYYIVPGDGVELTNDKVIGKDIILDQNSDISKLLKNEPGLYDNGAALIVTLELDKEKRKMLPSCAPKNICPSSVANGY